MGEGEETMLACYYKKFGGPEVDQVGQVPRPKEADLKPGQMIIEVHASSLNPADYKQRSGAMKLILSYKMPQIYGFDFSGVVVTSKSDLYQPGEEVFGMCKGLRRGGLAEYMIVDADICVKKPENVSHEDAASVPLVGITTMMAFRKMGLKENDTSKAPRFLITGGAGGVGSIAIQLAKSLYNASYIVTTASAGEKTDFVKSLGADRVINYREEDFSKVLLTTNDEERFDAIFDCTDEAKKCPPLLKTGGGLVSINTSPTALALQEFLIQSDTKNFQKITFGVEGFLTSKTGAVVFDRITGAKSLMNQCAKRKGTFHHIVGTGNGEMVQFLANELEQGRIKACIDTVYPLKDALDAVKHIESGRAKGKIVIKVK